MPFARLSASRPAYRATWHDWLAALVVIGACTLISELMAPYLDLADQIMVYLAGVVYVALRHGLAPSVASVVASIFLFDLIFVPPRWGLNPLNKQHLLTFVVMLLVGLLISRLAAQAREQTLLAQGRAQRAHAMNELSARLAVARSSQEVVDGVAAAVQVTFGAACAVHAPHAAPAGGTGLILPLQGTGAPLGQLAVQAAPGHAYTAEDHDLLNAFAHQTALALERCAFEQKTADALVEAETERLRNTLLSGISHDFRTPLTAIVGSATSLLQHDRLLDAAKRATLTRSILDEATRMHALVSDLLDLTRLEGGAVQLAMEWCPADELVESALQTLGVRAGAHLLRTQVPPDAIVWCDPRLVEQALVNLLDNALRYTPAGCAVDVAIDVQAGAWRLTVTDDGPGLPPGSHRDVFKKFHRGHSEPAGAGTGLGLAICAAVASLHNGTIRAASHAGAQFVMTFPQPAGAGALPQESA
jgi:two-component system sensor histidine kinase KdpD